MKNLLPSYQRDMTNTPLPQISRWHKQIRKESHYKTHDTLESVCIHKRFFHDTRGHLKWCKSGSSYKERVNSLGTDISVLLNLVKGLQEIFSY